MSRDERMLILGTPALGNQLVEEFFTAKPPRKIREDGC
jgi:hypothetical protein